MSESTAAPRRSQREKKQTKSFNSETTTGKRKRQAADTDDDEGSRDASGDDSLDADPEDDDEDSVVGDEDGRDDEDAEFAASKPKPARKFKSKSSSSKAKGPSAAKKPRTTGKVIAPRTTKASNATGVRKGRKPKANGVAFDPDQVEKDTKIKGDNPIFNAIINPAAALQGVAEDFLESLSQDSGTAKAELINSVLRACGCNDSVNADEVLDLDGIPDTLDGFTEDLKKGSFLDDSPTYPLTSKLPLFKKFRAHLVEFISRLITSAAELGSLYSTDLISNLLHWVTSMSSSQIRSFRHTATVVALEIEGALCDVARGVEKEVEVVGRQREGEKKRKSKGIGKGSVDKELEAKMKEVSVRKTKLLAFINEVSTGVFIHRYRDLDPLIRTECITSLGSFFKKYPSHFFGGNHLRYVGWLLSDTATNARLAAVKSLQIIYTLSSSDGDHLMAQLNHFTERFKPRLLEMAEGDTDVGVRVGVLAVLGEIDKAGLLEEQDRERLGSLIFCEDAKVRKAVAGFVKGVWEEWTEEQILEHGGSSNKGLKIDKNRVGIKGLAALLVKWGAALDKVLGDDEDPENGENEDATGGTSKASAKQTAAMAASTHKADSEGRTALAVEALWDEMGCVRDWEAILDMLLLDHSDASESQPASRGKRGRGRANGKKAAADDGDEDETGSIPVDEVWRLGDVEEAVLLEVAVASIKRAKKEATSAKKGPDEAAINEITRALIKGLPRLFIKNQTDEHKIAELLLLPGLMNLDLYLEMRMLNAYSSLWDDVIKQFTTHTSPTVLAHACATINCFMAATSLSNTNSTKILELEDELSSALRDSVAGRDEVETASFTDDEVRSLTALAFRITVLGGRRDMSLWIEENEGGKQSSAWDILSALAERGRLGYKEEEEMIDQILTFLSRHMMWKGKEVVHNAATLAEEDELYQSFKAQRDALLETLTEYAVGTQSNTAERVKRSAFENLLDIHVLFSPSRFEGEQEVIQSLSLRMDDEVQYRCAGYMQAEIERFADTLNIKTGNESDDEATDDEERDEKGKKESDLAEEEEDLSQHRLIREYVFIKVVACFVRAVRVRTIDIKHGAVVLAHYGRLGNTYDHFAKAIGDIVRDEALLSKNSDVAVSVIIQAIQEAFTLLLQGEVKYEDASYQLSKLLAQCFVLRGTQLAVVRRLDTDSIVHIHITLLSWIGKQLAQAQSQGKKKTLRTTALFFRTLIPLLSGVQPRDGLRIKAHLDQTVAQAKVEVSTSKVWDPYRSYEKRLGGIMTKDKGSGPKARKGRSAKAAITEDEGEESEVERLMDDQQHELAVPGEGLSTPKARPRPRPMYKAKSKSPIKKPTEPDPEEGGDDADDEPLGLATPTNSRKRARQDSAEPGAPQSNGVPPVEQAPIRRKRARH